MDTQRIGCILPIFGLLTLFFGFAAFDPAMMADMANDRRLLIQAVASGPSVGGFNLFVAILAVYLLFEFARFCWRWVDEVAATVTPDALVPHRSTFIGPIAWSDIASLSLDQIGRAPALVIRRRGGRERTVRGVESGDRANAFLDIAHARIDAAQSCANGSE